MLTILLFVIFIIRLLFDNEIIFNGSYNGLMLWYQRLIPLLLPFILMSSMLTDKALKYLQRKTNYSCKNNSKKSKLPIIIILLLGTLCGCPIGARTISTFYSNQQTTKRTSNLLLPACNNISPIFLTGYIYSYILNKKVNFLYIMIAIYIPYIAYLCTCAIFCSIHKQSIEGGITSNSYTIETENYALSSIVQITYIGLYIMVCSIIIEFIIYYKPFSDTINYILCSVAELSNGTKLLTMYAQISAKEKTALILALTSFGGVCTLIQTKKVIQGTRLSLLYYTVIKLICALCTYILTLLIL